MQLTPAVTAGSRPMSLARRSVGLAALLAVSTGCMWGCEQAISDRNIVRAELAEVRALTTSRKPDAVLLVDPRSPSAFAAGHLPGARNLTVSSVSGKRDDVDPSLSRYNTLMVYGDNPGSAPAIAMTKRLMATGYKDVRLFAGGLLEWRRAGYTVEASAPSATTEEPAKGAGEGETSGTTNTR